MKKKVLFICTHNSARSQIAEALLRKFFPDTFEAFSAGTEPSGVNPFTIKILEEEGIDTSSLKSKHVKTFIDKDIDLVITVCDHAKEVCPTFPYAKKQFHRSFPDPSSFEGTYEEKLEYFRTVKEQIKEWILDFFSNTKLLNM